MLKCADLKSYGFSINDISDLMSEIIKDIKAPRKYWISRLPDYKDIFTMLDKGGFILNLAKNLKRWESGPGDADWDGTLDMYI